MSFFRYQRIFTITAASASLFGAAAAYAYYRNSRPRILETKIVQTQRQPNEDSGVIDENASEDPTNISIDHILILNDVIAGNRNRLNRQIAAQEAYNQTVYRICELISFASTSCAFFASLSRIFQTNIPSTVIGILRDARHYRISHQLPDGLYEELSDKCLIFLANLLRHIPSTVSSLTRTSILDDTLAECLQIFEQSDTPTSVFIRIISVFLNIASTDENHYCLLPKMNLLIRFCNLWQNINRSSGNRILCLTSWKVMASLSVNTETSMVILLEDKLWEMGFAIPSSLEQTSGCGKDLIEQMLYFINNLMSAIGERQDSFTMSFMPIYCLARHLLNGGCLMSSLTHLANSLNPDPNERNYRSRLRLQNKIQGTIRRLEPQINPRILCFKLGPNDSPVRCPERPLPLQMVNGWGRANE